MENYTIVGLVIAFLVVFRPLRRMSDFDVNDTETANQNTLFSTNVSMIVIQQKKFRLQWLKIISTKMHLANKRSYVNETSYVCSLHLNKYKKKSFSISFKVVVKLSK